MPGRIFVPCLRAGEVPRALILAGVPTVIQWANELAWTQWTQDELRSGAAWEHLRQGVGA